MTVAESIRRTFVPINKDGYKFIAIFAGVTIILGLVWEPLFWIGVVLTVWCTYFFRDPERYSPLDTDLVLAPADGRVSSIVQMTPPAELGLGDGEMRRISIFMNVFNCHVNRAPAAGRIERIVYREGLFLNAELDKASEKNERNSIMIETANGRIGVVQVAGLVARRILCWAREGDVLQAGERFGLIRFGSRLDIYLPLAARPTVSAGQLTYAGETVIGEFHSAKGPVISRRD